MNKQNFVVIPIILVCLFVPSLFAQSQEPEGDDQKTIYKTLVSILKSKEALQEEIKSAEQELAAAKTEIQRASAEKALMDLNAQMETINLDFEKISTGVDPAALEEESDKAFDLNEEVQDLLKPLVKELKELTEDPRKEDRLRSEILFLKEKIGVVDRALTQIRDLILKTEDQYLKTPLKELEDQWFVKKQQFANQLTIKEYQLKEATSDKKPFWESAQIFFKSFFKNRGKNLLLSILAFICVFFGFRLIHRAVRKVSHGRQGKARSFTVCLVDVILYFLTFLLAFNAMMGVLFLSGDWVLLSLVIIFLLGVAWAARQGIPRFWEQIKFMLNLGTVKEDERVMYNGIPWRVVSLRFYCILENPELSTGVIKLPLRNLTDLVSRPCCKEEPWFPCRVGEWVILSDGTRGKVTLQTPEMVILQLPGGRSPKTYVTSDFLGLNPINISKGFRIKVTFGVDYEHQAESTKEIPEKMGAFIRNGFESEGYGKEDLSLRAELGSAGASSLDYTIVADFSAKAAPRAGRVERAISRLAVDACNKYGWGIPFTSITLHTASPEKQE